MSTIRLIRHGIIEWNSLGKAQGVSDIPLNELGRKQVSEIGDINGENKSFKLTANKVDIYKNDIRTNL
ncbi:histidine phosphatase family protein [Fictibacillus nanhaiensis]|uniref:histidine phosphatase family protein n=1 Tax=Fictibacillus nanhaiensis TaxID=742169 RepID=UPI001C96C3AF|nr:histidine phosphatase family protein [Fictibacillus nanhaiensis]MBY6036964.1 histidine phosphatase family protein [Fictibacillus nanhaiensis]